MYTILVTEQNELVTSVKERIMQRSKLVDKLQFLMEPNYKGNDMSTFTVMLEYLLPVSKEYKTEYLVLSDELYKDKLVYSLPFDTYLTREAGSIEIKLTCVKVDLTAEGKPIQRVRKIGPGEIIITPLSAWSDIIADNALTALDQRLIQIDAMLNAANEMNQYIYETKADNIVYNEADNTIQLTSNGVPIGDKLLCSNIHGYSVTNVEIDEDGNLITTFSDGKIVNAGKVSGKDGSVYVPHISDDYVLSWTNTAGLPCPEPIDLFPYDEWKPIEQETTSVYVWEQI